MKTLSRFIGKFAKLIVAVLSSHDRTILKSYLSITNGAALEVFVDQALKIRLRGFMAFAEKQSEILVDPPSTWLRSPVPEYRFLQEAHCKQAIANEFLRQRPNFAWSAAQPQAQVR